MGVPGTCENSFLVETAQMYERKKIFIAAWDLKNSVGDEFRVRSSNLEPSLID